MPGLRLDIETSSAKRNLNKALQEMQAAASVPIKAKLKIDTSSIKRAKKEISALRREMANSLGANNLGSNTRKKSSNNDSKQITKITQRRISDIGKAINQLNKKEAQLRDKTSSFEKLLSKRKLNGVPEYVEQLAQLEKALTKIDTVRSNLKNKESKGVSVNKSDQREFSKVLKTAERLQSEIDLSQSKIKQSFDSNTLDSALSKTEKKISDIQSKYKNFLSDNDAKIHTTALKEADRYYQNMLKTAEQVSDARKMIESNPSNISHDKGIRFQQLSEDAKQAADMVDTSMKKIENSLKSVKLTDKDMRTFDKVGNRLSSYFKQYGSQIMKDADIYSQFRTLEAKVNHGDFGSGIDATNAFAQFRMNARRAGVEVDTLGAKLERTFGARLRSALAGEGVMMISTALRDIVQNAIDVDTAMTELKKVTDLTDTGYVKFLDDTGGRASKLGATLTEVVNATAEYARLGFSVPKAQGLADSALIYNNVGDDLESIDDATSHLISTMQGFGIASEDSLKIVDKFNEVSNRFPSSAGDIGAMVMRSASAMAAANNDLDETIALGVTANTVVQDADVVGEKMCLAA